LKMAKHLAAGGKQVSSQNSPRRNANLSFVIVV